METKVFAARLAQLRIQKGVSAREMSLALGQNAGYINSIETGRAFPSMVNFFYICEYLNIEPADFFNLQSTDPSKFKLLINNLRRLDVKQLTAISALVDSFLAE